MFRVSTCVCVCLSLSQQDEEATVSICVCLSLSLSLSSYLKMRRRLVCLSICVYLSLSLSKQEVEEASVSNCPWVDHFVYLMKEEPCVSINESNGGGVSVSVYRSVYLSISVCVCI